ncbi:MAG TPA: alanine racemase, partial [Longimicrobium sp.]|nr:alanine racemase [Longimicrobium sp.]
MSNPSTARSRAWVEVDLGALKENLEAIRAAAPGCAVLPMLKANAYGTGVERVHAALAEMLAPEGPWAFGVAAVAEGEALRSFGWTGRVVVFSPVPPGEEPRAARANLTVAVSDLEALARWRAAAEAVGERRAFHLEVDTGMGRAGFPCGAADSWG